MGKILHASYSGWFPTCIQEVLPPISEERLNKEYSGRVIQPDNPNKKALDMLMALYWRVKTWRIYYKDEGADGSITELELYLTPYDQDGYLIFKEEKLVCEALVDYTVPNWSIGRFSLFTSNFFNMYYSIVGLDKNIDTGEYGSFRFACKFDFEKASDGTQGAYVYSDLSSPHFTECQIADIGKLRFHYSYMPGITLSEPTFQITPFDYWTYDGMYDALTGFPV